MNEAAGRIRSMGMKTERRGAMSIQTFGGAALQSNQLFFFQAEGDIRDLIVTGVQTCALPISFVLVLPGRRVGHHPPLRLAAVSTVEEEPAQPARMGAVRMERLALQVHEETEDGLVALERMAQEHEEIG